MYILGISAYHADASAVLIENGGVVAALEEERFRRVKHWAGFPTLAIRRCLEIAGIRGTDVRTVAIGRDPSAHLLRKAWFTAARRPSLAHVADRVANAQRIHSIAVPLAHALDVAPGALPRIHNVEHHPAHLASAFFVSPFQDAAICAVDAFGDFVSTSTAVGTDSHIDVLSRTYFPHSLGIVYTAVTQYLGFTRFGDEFKVMGLAPYGRPTVVDELRQLVKLKPRGRFTLDLDYFTHASSGVTMQWSDGYPTLGPLYSNKMESLLGGPARASGAPPSDRERDIAHSLQVVWEEWVAHVLNGLWHRTKNPRLCLAGGGAMNSVANGTIRDRSPFTDIYVQPAAGDNGTALGAAFWIWHEYLQRPRRFVMNHAYWGTAYPDAEIALALPQQDDGVWRYEHATYREDELCRQVAALIADGNIVGWFQGRMEWGARALGNRSILADPRRADMRDVINAKIKFRELFRPFAPSILEESLSEYFETAAADAFMQQVGRVRADKQASIPAVTHVDGTSRLQIVSERVNGRYHRLIREFARITGVPVLLNTSFNENEPIVDTPAQALDCFLRTSMDVLVVGNTVVRRVPAEVGAFAEIL